jgi:hypothetical protein
MARSGVGLVHAGSVRVGLLRTPAATLAFVQVGDLAAAGSVTPWEALNTLFLPAESLGGLADAVDRARVRIRELRARP